jgi:very-short-patch-repair endonuclease
VRQTSKATVRKARALRKRMSPTEARLWQVLRQRPEGLKFRKQHPAAPFVLDFYCPAAKLVVEVDGDVHGMGAMPAKDARRDEWLGRRGLRTLRIPAAEIYRDLEAVVRFILLHCPQPRRRYPSTTLRVVPLPMRLRLTGRKKSRRLRPRAGHPLRAAKPSPSWLSSHGRHPRLCATLCSARADALSHAKAPRSRRCSGSARVVGVRRCRWRVRSLGALGALA